MRKLIKVFKVLSVTLLSLLRVVRHSRFPNNLAELPLVTEECVVLGNGPSLNIDFEKVNNIRCTGDVWCVNQFAESTLYERIKPNNYVFADPSYWGEAESENMIKQRVLLFNHILNKTTWQLTIYAPFPAKRSFEEIFGQAANISLHFYNCVPLFGAKIITRMLYGYGLGMPQVQNVLVAALFLSLRRGYKKIFILGADHSWHETFQLDEANRLCFRDQHFYGVDAKLVPFTMGGDEQTTFTMPEIFIALAKMFEGYWMIQEYSEYIGAEICNASSVTYIDAFRRVKPTDMNDCSLGRVGVNESVIK